MSPTAHLGYPLSLLPHPSAKRPRATPGTLNAPDDDDPTGELDVSDENTPEPADRFRALPPGADPNLDWGLDCHLGPDGQPRIIERRFTVSPEFAGMRLDHYIKTQIPRLSRTKIQAVITQTLERDAASTAHIAPRGALRANSKVTVGEAFTLRRAARAEPPCPRNIAVVYADDDVLVIDKPAGLPVHSTAKFYYNTLTRIMFETMGPGLQLCHRLDRETSGVVVVAKHKAAASSVKQAFAKKTVHKTYVALVLGHPPWPLVGEGEFAVDAPLHVAQRGDATQLVGVRMMTEGPGLPSKTMFAVMGRSAHYSLVRCRPITGRQHQIRAHLAYAGFPIVGDKIYAHGDQAFIDFCDQGWTPERAAEFVLWRHALHAAEVDFPHPDGTRRVVAAPLPGDMADLFARDS